MGDSQEEIPESMRELMALNEKAAREALSREEELQGMVAEAQAAAAKAKLEKRAFAAEERKRSDRIFAKAKILHDQQMKNVV